MDFGDVIRGLKIGRRYQRAGWNGKNMFIFLVPGSVFKTNREPLLSILGEGVEVEYHAHIDMKTAQGYVVPWLASQVDMLAGDWQEVSVSFHDVTARDTTVQEESAIEHGLATGRLAHYPPGGGEDDSDLD